MSFGKVKGTYVDHDHLLAFRVPGPGDEKAFGVCWRAGQIEQALHEVRIHIFIVEIGFTRTATPIVKVSSPSIRNNQNQPVFPWIPRIWRIPAASKEETIRATYE